MVQFSQDDWDALTPHDKHALRTLGRVAPIGFEPVSKFAGVGRAKIESLVEKGLAHEGRTMPRNEIGYGLTEKGSLAFEWCQGNRMTEFPKS